MKLSEHFASVDDFMLMIRTAEPKTISDAEDKFLAGLVDKAKAYKLNMFFSQAQSQWLCDIAAR